MPNNTPGHNRHFHPAVQLSIDNLGGNSIVLDLGYGQFAHCFHLFPGSIRVKVGDLVRRGERIARIGASGDAREPHLHFEVSTSAKLLSGEGVPYLIDHYRVIGDQGETLHRHQLPMESEVIDFGQREQ